MKQKKTRKRTYIGRIYACEEENDTEIPRTEKKNKNGVWETMNSERQIKAPTSRNFEKFDESVNVNWGRKKKTNGLS